mgnify:CR=1 FL=1
MRRTVPNIYNVVYPEEVTQPLCTFKSLSRIFLGLLVVGFLTACSSNALKMGLSDTVSAQVETYCIKSVSVRTGNHEMPAFNDASLRAMKTELSNRGYGVSCEAANPALHLDYAMTFDAQSLSWQATMRVLDAHGNVLRQVHADDAIHTNGAFQYTTESTAQKLLREVLNN